MSTYPRYLCSIVSLLMSATALPAVAAAFSEVYVAPSGETIAIDRESLSRRDEVVTLWFRNDRQMPDEQGARSRTVYADYDCASRRWRPLFIAIFRETQGRDRIAAADADAKWRPLIPGSNGEFIFTVVCTTR